MGDYRPEDIEYYRRITAGMEPLPPMLGTESIHNEATRRIVSELTPGGSGVRGRKVRSPEELTEDILGLEALGALDGSLLVSPYVYRNFAFSQVLHDRLHSDRRGETMQYLGDGLSFARTYMGTVLSQYATDPERQYANTQKLFNSLRVHQRGTDLDLSKLILTANSITAKLNEYGNTTEKLTSFGSVSDFRHVSAAFFRILGLTRTQGGESPELAADRTHAEIIESILGTVIKQELGREFITITELAERYPGASRDELTHMIRTMQHGRAPYHALSEQYRKILGAQGKRVYWNRGRSGYGILS